MNSFLAGYIFIIGLCIGSFLNVFILRGLKGENFITERSKCPKCGNQLKWYMNIPLISYAFLRGKCAFCKEKISIQYPLIEFICGCCFLISFLSFGCTIKTVFVCIFFSLFISIAATDILETVIIDYHAYMLLAFAVLGSFLNIGNIMPIQSILGAIAGFLIVEIIARIGYFIANYRIFGEGDSLIALGLGAIFGIKGFIVIIGLSILIQSILAIPILIINAFRDNKKRLAFSYIVVLISLFITFYINFIKTITSKLAYSGYIILIVTGLLWSLKNILNSVKNKQELSFEEAKEKFSLLPFGPAMIIASTIGIFYLEQIKTMIKIFLF